MAPFALLSASYFAHVGFFNPYLALWLKDMGFGLVAISLLTAAQAATRVVGPYGWGWLSDRTGERVKLLRYGATASLTVGLALFLDLPVAALFGVLLVMFIHTSFMMPMQGKGHALPSLVRLEGTPGSVFYSVHDGPITKGMSGGPVFADDGQVVGINIAFIPKNEIDARTRPDLADKERVSVFMSYSEIDKEWRRYQSLLAHKAKPRAPAAVKGYVAVAAKP